MNCDSTCWVVIPAAGHGERMGANIPKQYMRLNGITLLEHTASRFLEDSRILGIRLVVDFEMGMHTDTVLLNHPKVSFIQGGLKRSDSVLAGLNSLVDIADETDWVLVHDAARPCVRAEEIHKLIDSVSNSGIGGILAQPMMDTVKQANTEGTIEATLERDTLWRALTPQMFSLGLLREAISDANAANISITDEAAAMERMGHPVQLVQGFSTNIKVTVPSDFELARVFLQYLEHQTPTLEELE